MDYKSEKCFTDKIYKGEKMIFDLHCDTIWKIDMAREKNEQISLKKSSLQIDEEKLLKGGYFAQCFAIYIPNKYENPYERCLNAISIYQTELAKSENLLPVYNYEDFKRNEEQGKISSVLTMEDGCPIGEDLYKLDNLYNLGVRMICLTHNLINPIGYPNFGKYFPNGSPDRTVPNVTRGLTDFGRTLIKKMNKLGVVIDVSHLSDKGFYDVIELSEKPIVASHSNARAVCGNIRNLTDDMLYKLADNGGVMGMNYANHFLHDNAEQGRKTIECVLEHIKYIKKKIGVEHIALGSDFDGIDSNIQLKDASRMEELIEILEKATFTSGEIENITHKNALRVFKASM